MSSWLKILGLLGLGVVIGAVLFNSPNDQPHAQFSKSPESTVAGEQESQPAAAGVGFVIDGDTIVLTDGSRVRLIGIDSPESGKLYFREAKNKLTELLGSGPLRLEKDISETDRYGRLLRYIYAGDLFVNLEMVTQGYATAATYPPDVKHSAEFVAAERAAREQGRGLWERTAPDEEAASAASGTTAFTLPACAAADCDCSDFSSHEQAQWFHENYDPSDSHRLDRDQDGLACESI